MVAKLVRLAGFLGLLCGCGAPFPATGSQVLGADVPDADVAVLSVGGAAVVWIVDR
jgi:hypothetical protein